MRARILVAARELVLRQGVKGLGMRTLASEAGLTAPTLYGYFASKDAVLDALFQQATEMLFASMQRARDEQRSGELPRFSVDAIAFRAFAHEHPELYQLLFGRVDSAYKPCESAREYANAMMRTLSERVIPEIVAAGVTDALAEACFQALVVTAQGYISIELNDCLCNRETLAPRQGSEQEYLMLLDMMLAGFVSASERARRNGALDEPSATFGIVAASG